MYQPQQEQKMRGHKNRGEPSINLSGTQHFISLDGEGAEGIRILTTLLPYPWKVKPSRQPPLPLFFSSTTSKQGKMRDAEQEGKRNTENNIKSINNCSSVYLQLLFYLLYHFICDAVDVATVY